MNEGATNIWEGLNFENVQSKSAYDYLIEQSKSLTSATGSELKMDVERVDSYLEGDIIIPVAVSKLYVIAPKLGNFRRKLLTVVEGKNGTNFPVDIYCHIDDKKEMDITESDFLTKINEIIRRPLVQSSILSLYKQSKEVIDNSRLSFDMITSKKITTTISWSATPIYWSKDGTKGYVIMDIQGYDFPMPYWGKLFHLTENKDKEYEYLEDDAKEYINKPEDKRIGTENDLRSILIRVKDDTVKKIQH